MAGSTVSYDPEAFGRFSESIARYLGTARFLVWQTVIIVLWLRAQHRLPAGELAVRPMGRGLVLLTLVLSLQASYAAPLILLAQNRQERRDRVAAEHDREVAERTQADTEFLAREIAGVRLALADVVTGEELRDQLEALARAIERTLAPARRATRLSRHDCIARRRTSDPTARCGGDRSTRSVPGRHRSRPSMLTAGVVKLIDVWVDGDRTVVQEARPIGGWPPAARGPRGRRQRYAYLIAAPIQRSQQRPRVRRWRGVGRGRDGLVRQLGRSTDLARRTRRLMTPLAAHARAGDATHDPLRRPATVARRPLADRRRRSGTIPTIRTTSSIEVVVLTGAATPTSRRSSTRGHDFVMSPRFVAPDRSGSSPGIIRTCRGTTPR